MAFFTMLLFLVSAFVAGVAVLPVLLLTLYLRLQDVPATTSTTTAPTGGSGHKIKLDAETLASVNGHPLKPHSAHRRSGWITVRRTFESVAESITGQSGEGGYLNSALSGYRSFMDSRSKDPRRSRPKDKFFAVLEGTQLSLYEDEQMTERRTVIRLPLHEVVIFPEHLIEGELFMKKNAICLRPIIPAGSTSVDTSTSEAPSLVFPPTPPHQPSGISQPTSFESTAEHGGYQPYFLFPKINTDKEDWHHSLIASSRLGSSDPSISEKDSEIFNMEDMLRFVGSIDEQADSIPVRWLNAMFGRLFFSVYRTSAVQDYIHRKLMKKISKISLPSYLGDIVVEQVDVGDAVPLFSKPMLKELTAEGDACMEIQMKYTGNFKLRIATSVKIEIGTKKAYSLRGVLSATLKELEGTIQIKIKKSPTNRIWWGFTSMPRMVLDLRPELGPKSIAFSPLVNGMMGLINDGIRDSIVFPHMDDIAFMDTMDNVLRGGIFGDCLKKESTAASATAAGEHGSEGESEEVNDASGLMPGVPNLKLGDDKGDSTTEGLRKRPTQGRKVSDPSSVKSTQSSKLSSLFGNSSSHGDAGVSTTANGTTTAKDHSRKKSWFTNSASPPSLPKSRLHSTESDTALPLASNSTKADLESRGIDVKKTTPRKSETLQTSASTGSISETAGTDGAVDRLRDILEHERAKAALALQTDSTLTTSSDSLEIPSSTSTLERSASAPPAAAAAVQAPPSSLSSVSSSLLARSSSASSDETTRTTPAPSLASSTADYTKFVDESASTSSPVSPTSTTSKPSLFRKKSDKADSSARSVSSGNSAQEASAGPTSTSAILNSWKAKAADKQAIQDGVAQAKQHMAKWSNTWKAYRKQGLQEKQAADAQASADENDPLAQGVADVNGDLLAPSASTVEATPVAVIAAPSLRRVPSFSNVQASPVLGHAHVIDNTPSSRSRSGSVVSTSPTGHFRPPAAVTTTSLSTGDAVSMLSESTSAVKTSPSPVRRVPPPSTVPVHPAFASSAPKRNSLSGPGGRQSQPSGYKPAAMMAIPGIDDSRRFNLSSEDAAKKISTSQSPPSEVPTLPARPVMEAVKTVEAEWEETSPALAQRPFLGEEVPALPARPIKQARERMPSSNDADDSGVDMNAVPEVSIDPPTPKEENM